MTGKNSEPDTLRGAMKHFLYSLAGLAVLLGIEQVSIWYASSIPYYEFVSIVLNLGGIIYLLAVAISAWEVHKLGRQNPKLRPLFGIINLVALGVVIYLVILVWNWDSVAWVHTHMSLSAIFTPEFEYQILLLYGWIVKFGAISLLGVVALATVGDTVEMFSDREINRVRKA